MKVKPGTDMGRVAHWLNFLRQALGVHTAVLAKAHGMRRSNLTTFMYSGGRPGSVSPEKACNALLSLGLQADGTLRPGLHRWCIPSGEMAATLVDLIGRADVAWGVLLVLRQGGAYLMVRMGRLICVFVELGDEALATIHASSLLDRVVRITLDQDGDAATKMLWQNEDDQDVLNHFDALRNPAELAPATPTRI